MSRRIRITEAPVVARSTLKLPVQRPAAQTVAQTQKPLSPPLLNLQQALGNRAVQRIILSRQPDGGAGKGAQAVETVPTDWYLDSWGVGSDIGGRAGRRDSRPDDVLMVEGLKIGSGQNFKLFEQAGNALRSGRSALGPFDHTKGPGHVNGVVKYISQREILVNYKPNLPPESGPVDKAVKAQRLSVETETKKMVLDLIRDEASNSSGNWDELEQKAAAAAAAKIPGSKPEIKIDTRVQHTGHRLETTQYSIDKPSTCTIKIIVPTSTTTYQVHGGESNTVTVSGGVSSSKKDTEKINMGWEVQSYIQKTKSSFIETVNSLHHQITSPGGGEISSEKESGKDSDPGVWERAKKFVKEKASDLWEKAKSTLIDKGIGFLKSKVASWIIKGLELESFIEVKLAEWVVDWLGDKASDKLKDWLVKGKKDPVKKPCPPKSATHTPSQSDPSQSDPRLRDKCPNCHDRHPGPNPTPTPTPTPQPVPIPPGPVEKDCPKETQPPVLKTDDVTEIDAIFSQSTNEIVTTAQHYNVETSKEESVSGHAEGSVTHHTEHYYSGPVTKETIGHPAIELIVEDRN